MNFWDVLSELGRTAPVTFAALFPVVNPVGTAILFQALTDGTSDLERRELARAVVKNSVALLAVVLLAGSSLLSVFGISIPIVQLAGGLVLGVMGWNMLNAPATKTDAPTAPSNGEALRSQAFYPLAFPLTVGPGCVAVTLTLSAHTARPGWVSHAVAQAGALLAVAALGVVTYLCFVSAGKLTKRLGPSGTAVMMRLMAFVIVCIGAQICWSGVRALAPSLR